MRLPVYPAGVGIGLLILSGCATQPQSVPARYYFSLDSTVTQTTRFAYTQEWDAKDAATRDVKKASAGRRNRMTGDEAQGKGSRRREQADDRGAEQSSMMNRQLLAELDEELVQRELCQYGYRVLDLQRQPGRVTLIGECKPQRVKS